MGKWRSSEEEAVIEAAAADAEKMFSDQTALVSKLQSEDARDLPVRAQFVKALFDLDMLCPVRLAYRLASFGLPVYLIRHRTGCQVAVEGALADLIAKREILSPVIVCPLNVIFNDVLKRVGKPLLGADGLARFISEQSQKFLRSDLTAQERKVVALIRERDYQRVTVHVKGGDVIYADLETEEQVQEEQAKRILDVLNSKSYETMTVHVRDGKVIQLGRKSRQKLSAVTG